ncbi:MAG: anti-sigma factor domain-containing protein [Christensenella sp.]|nr:anti-sigma factor domain-containing protein [Christensenella sp.]
MKREMDACIVELRGRYAAALTSDGQFVRIRNHGFSVGQTVRLTKRQTMPAQRRQLRALTAVAAGLLFLVLGGFKGYQTPVGVVSLDVNPSIEYSINVFDRVLSVRGVNEDGEVLLNQMDATLLKNRPVAEAVEQTIESLRESGYFPQDAENDVVLAASSYSTQHAEQLAEQLKGRVARQSDLTILSFSVTHQEVEQAHALGSSAGKVRIVQQLEQSNQAGNGFQEEDWLEKPVRDILQETQEQQMQTQTQSSGEQQNAPQPQGTPPPAPEATPNPVSVPQEPAPDGEQAFGDGQPSPSPTVSPKSGTSGGKGSSGSDQPPRK